MNPSPRPSTLRPAVFRDGLGERRRMADASGVEKLEILCLRRDLSAADAFEESLRARATELADFRSPSVARVRTVERLNDPAATLVVASEPAAGVRLSSVLTIADRHGLSMDGGARWWVIKQLVAAVGALHRHGPGTAHGAIAAERTLVTPEARVILVEHVLGPALQRLQLSPDRYWRELRVACPPGPAVAFDQRQDVAQIGVVALSVILGRLLSDDEYPGRVMELVESGWATATLTDIKPTPAALRVWLTRALQIDPRQSFGSAIEADSALDKAIVESGYSIGPADLQAFLALCEEPGEIPVKAPQERVADVKKTAPPVPAARAQGKATAAKPLAAKAAPAPPATPAAPAGGPEPVRPEIARIPGPSISVVLSSLSASNYRRMAAGIALVVVLSGAGWAAANRIFDSPATAAAVATAAPVETPPPVPETVPPAEPEVGAESMPIAPLGAPGGHLEVRTEPPGATVTIAGQRRGVTPLTISDLPPGRHTVLLESSAGSVRRTVQVDPGVTASLVADLAPPAPTTGFLTVTSSNPVDILENGRLLGSSQSGRITLPPGPHQLEIVNQALGYRIVRAVQVAAGANTPIAIEFPKGTLALNAIPWAEVFVDGEKVGDTPIGNLPVSVGQHEVVFRNPDLGEQRMTATVTLTAPTRLSVDLRKR